MVCGSWSPISLNHWLPLFVLVHVVYNLVPLFDDSNQLSHELLISTFVLLIPVFLWERTRNLIITSAVIFSICGVLTESVCRSQFREVKLSHTRFVEKTPELILHISLPLFQILLLSSAMSKHPQRSVSQWIPQYVNIASWHWRVNQLSFSAH